MSAWIDILEHHPTDLGILDVRIKLYEGDELNVWSQSDRDFYWRVKDAFISESIVEEWMPLDVEDYSKISS